MNPNQLAIIVSYYLARFDREALTNLGYASFNEAFEAVGDTLQVKKNYVKLRRDEFDPAFPWREGWKRSMDKRIVKTIELFQDLDEPEMREIVLKILKDNTYQSSEELTQITGIINSVQPDKKGDKKKMGGGLFILRGPTGKKAEAFFQSHFNQTFEPVKGNLIDTREWGCGYDFKIESGKRETFVEVKGLSEISGGILFTDKEWKTAKEKTDSYYLAIVRNVTKEPEIQFFQNPAGIFQPNKNIYTSIQVQWSVSDKVLKNTSFS